MSPVEINGLDEAGRVGEDILFTRVAVERDFELHLLLHNLSSFNKLIPNKNDVKGYDIRSLIKYAKEVIESGIFGTAIYKMRSKTQVLLLRLLYSFLSEDLFRTRGEILELFNKKDWSVIQVALNSLNRFKRKWIFAESFVKAFGMKKIVEDVGKFYVGKYGSINELSSDLGPRIIVQIDGGFPFAFWWKDLLENAESGLVKGKCLITGITNGDEYYPTMATAGTISNILLLHPEVHYLFPIKELDETRLDTEKENFYDFYKKHSYALSTPIYQNRILVIGEIVDQLKCCIPYLFHIQEERTKTFETFSIIGTLENFLRDFGYGTKENTNIVVGKITSSLDKQNLEYSKEKGYTIKYLPDFQATFTELLSKLYSEIELTPSGKRADLERKLSNVKSVCQEELK
jgi:hypothetical protein